MTEYPIVQSRHLDPPRRAMFRRRRHPSELPVPLAHEVLVYSVRDRYVVDRERWPPHHDMVLDAHAVSVVDVRTDVPVVTELRLPAVDAVDFTARVTFLCTVVDPAVVVRHGVSLDALLETYLKQHTRILDLAAQHRIDQINEARVLIRAQIRAYATLRPPVAAGVTVTVAGAELLTPAELATFHQARRSQRFEQTLEAERQEHQHTLTSEKNAFEREELREAIALIGDDPRRALQLAFVAGQLDAAGLADRLREEKEREQRVNDEADRRRAEQDGRRMQWDREDRARRDERERDDEARQLEARTQLLRELARRGHLDMATIDVDRLIMDAGGGPPDSVGVTIPPRQLSTSPLDRVSAELREEDDD